MNMKKVINKSNLILWIVAIAALIGMIIYIVTSVTGYLTDAVMNPMPVICTVVAIIAAVFAAIGEEKGKCYSIRYIDSCGKYSAFW